MLAIHETNVDNIDSILKNGLLVGKNYTSCQSPYYKKTGSFLFPMDALDILIAFVKHSGSKNKSFIQQEKTPLYIVAEVSNNCKIGDGMYEGHYPEYCRTLTTVEDYDKNNKRKQYETPEIFCEYDIKKEDIKKIYSREQLFELYDKCDSINECINKEIQQ